MKKIYNRTEVEKIVEHVFYHLSDNGEEMTGKEYMDTFQPNETITISADEKDFLKKMEWYCDNIQINTAIVICKKEIKTKNINVKKRERYISLMEMSENREIGAKDFFDSEFGINKKIVYKIDGEEVSKNDIDKIKSYIAKSKQKSKPSTLIRPWEEKKFHGTKTDKDDECCDECGEGYDSEDECPACGNSRN